MADTDTNTNTIANATATNATAANALTLVCVRGGEPLPDVSTRAGISAIDPRERALHAPDLHLLALGRDVDDDDDGGLHRLLRARCSCWWRRVPSIDGHRVATIGHYAAADGDAGRWLIERACRELSNVGATLAIAPMDGNTWRRYRFVIERGDEPPFFLEPDQPDAWPDHFRAAGFTELATYTSALTEDLAQHDPRLDAAAARLAARGVTIRPFDPAPARADADLRRIFALSLASFSRNYLYTPIDEAEFIDSYRAVLPIVRICPELVLLAERGPELVGFLFALPNLPHARPIAAGNAAASNAAAAAGTDAIVIKTVAVAPGAAYAGLGSVLVGMVQREAHARGFRRAIHALMHERNVSQNISRRYARTIRRYALFSRALGPNA